MATQQIITYDIPEKTKRNFFRLYSFVLGRSIRLFFSTLLFRILFLCMMLSFVALATIPNNGIVHTVLRYFYNVNIVLVLLPFVLSLEETFHAGIAVQKGKSDCVKNLNVILLKVKPNKELSVMSEYIKFEGKFSPVDIIHINGGSPLMAALCTVTILWFLQILCARHIAFPKVVWMLPLIPISSLIPYKIAHFMTDGYTILTTAKASKISLFRTLTEVLRGMYYAVLYTIPH